MIVIGLTGSIAMGKSETARMFRDLSVPVFDADATVHALYGPRGGAVKAVAAAFPGVEREGAIDRRLLGDRLARDEAAFRTLEAIVHPLVRAEQERFLARCREAGASLAVLDIPLLFETGRGPPVDVTVVVSAPPEMQRRRALARPGMSAEKFQRILWRQMPDEEKRARADFVVDSARGREHALAQVRLIVDSLRLGTEPVKHA